VSKLDGGWRILDANLNRAREAARVAEEYARFVLDAPGPAGRLKGVRHALRSMAEVLGPARLLAARDTPGDVGTRLSARAESERVGSAGVALAAFKRLQEALRVIEEYAKVEEAEVASKAEGLRYEAYALESELLSVRARLAGARLYVIVTEGLCGGRPADEVVRAVVEGGAEMVQLREKEMDGAAFLELAVRLRRVTAESGALLIINDRVDIAAACGADGVHLGQSDLPCGEARKLLGEGAIVGVTARNIEQVVRAAADGADYVGVGTVFATATKQVGELCGLGYIRAVAAKSAVPFFAIGGVNAGNVASVVEAGAERVAVCSAVIGAEDVTAAAKAIRVQLPGLGPGDGSDG